MLYTILEASKQIGVSKVTVYKKIKNSKELKRYIQLKDGVQYINDEGIVKLKELIDSKHLQNEKNKNKPDKDISSLLTELNSSHNSAIDGFKEQINYLKKIIEEKDRQIERNQITINQSQVLLQQKEEKVLQLEMSSKEKRKFWSIFNK